MSSLNLTTATRSNTGRHDALAGAFTRAVASAPALSEPTEHPLAGDEWYVGVNDQPIGPIRLAEIQDRAARGEITAECLVWRDGFEDWKPLTAFPELVAVVEDGIGSLRSIRPPAVQEQRAPAPPAAIPAPGPAQPEPALSVSAGSGNADVETFDYPAGLAKPKIPLAAWFAVAMALVLGVTIGLVLMKPEPPKEIVKYVEVPVTARPAIGDIAPPPAPVGETKLGTDGVNSDVVVAAERRGTASSPRKLTANGTADSPNGAASADAPTQGLKGLQGLQGLGAPRTGPASEVAASSAGRQQLDSATLSRTVSRYTASVKRSCWQPALDTRAPDASTTARISANIVVAPSGKVQAVTVSADPKGYRGLSSCIQARVRNWEFPPAGGSTEFNVPFVFAAQ
ncbi:MAG TPA: GYF domain-containing protein [Polyangiaceae bacterium]